MPALKICSTLEYYITLACACVITVNLHFGTYSKACEVKTTMIRNCYETVGTVKQCCRTGGTLAARCICYIGCRTVMAVDCSIVCIAIEVPVGNKAISQLAGRWFNHTDAKKGIEEVSQHSGKFTLI